MEKEATRSRGKPEVLIVGAGPVGLALAIELGQRGVNCLLIDKNPRAGAAPRAKTVNVRTCEHFRRWGISEALRAAAPLGIDYPSSIAFTTRMSGHLLTRFNNALYCAPGRNPMYSEHAQWTPQYTVERVMREHIETIECVQAKSACELQRFTQNDSGVAATLVDLRTGLTSEVETQYIVGCDGASSVVRDLIGSRLEGAFGLSRNYNVVFRAPGLAAAHSHNQAIMYWQINGEVPSHIGPMDAGDLWFFMPTGLAPDVQVTKENAGDLIRRATGIDLPFEVISVDEWTAHRAVADKYRAQRVFLAGDACHLHPPYGGFGMNMGIADAVDLGWKLAAVLRGWGGATLLQSYELERRPVHMHVLKEASQNHSKVGAALFECGLEDESEDGELVRKRVGQRINAEKLSEFYTLGTILGDRYLDSPVVQKLLDRDAPPRDFLNYIPSSMPGARAPHAWLHDGSSLFDHFGRGFTLLVRPAEDHGDIDAAVLHAERQGVPFSVLRLDNPAVNCLYEHRLTLIRPDQHIAWVGNKWPKSSELDVFAMVTGRSSRINVRVPNSEESIHE